MGSRGETHHINDSPNALYNKRAFGLKVKPRPHCGPCALNIKCSSEGKGKLRQGVVLPHSSSHLGWARARLAALPGCVAMPHSPRHPAHMEPLPSLSLIWVDFFFFLRISGSAGLWDRFAGMQ